MLRSSTSLSLYYLETCSEISLALGAYLGAYPIFCDYCHFYSSFRFLLGSIFDFWAVAPNYSTLRLFTLWEMPIEHVILESTVRGCWGNSCNFRPFRFKVPPRRPRRDSLSNLSNYSTWHVQPVQQVRVVCPAHRSSSVEPPGSFPENSVQAESPSQINVPSTPFASFSSPPSRSPSPTSSQPLFVHFQPASPDSPLTPTTPQGISVVAPLPPIFLPPVFTPSMASVNPVGAAHAPRVQAVVSITRNIDDFELLESH